MPKAARDHDRNAVQVMLVRQSIQDGISVPLSTKPSRTGGPPGVNGIPNEGDQ
jgi:hypothetical protein